MFLMKFLWQLVFKLYLVTEVLDVFGLRIWDTKVHWIHKDILRMWGKGQRYIHCLIVMSGEGPMQKVLGLVLFNLCLLFFLKHYILQILGLLMKLKPVDDVHACSFSVIISYPWKDFDFTTFFLLILVRIKIMHDGDEHN